MKSDCQNFFKNLLQFFAESENWFKFAADDIVRLLIKEKMKKIIILIALFVSLAAQAYEPLIREDRIWEYYDKFERRDTIFGGLVSYKFDGKQEIDGIEYHQFKYIPGNIVVALLREEDGKIYLYCDPDNVCIGMYSYNKETKWIDEKELTDNKEFVLYDFTHTDPTDEFYAMGHYPYNDDQGRFWHVIVPYLTVSVDSIPDYPGRKFTLSNQVICNGYDADDFFNRFGEYFDKVYIVEGVGNVGLGDFIKPETPCSLIRCGSTMTRSYIDDIYYDEIIKPIFNNLYDLDGNVVYPGAQIERTGVESVQTDAKVDSQMYDLFGRVITDPAPGTVYIRNGRKEIAR